MPTKNVVLTDQQAQMLERWVSTGRYQNASEVLREGLRMVAQRELEDEWRLATLQQAAQAGVTDMASGAFDSFNSVAELKRHLSALKAQAVGQ